MKKPTMLDLVAQSKFWMTELGRDNYTSTLWELRFGVNGLEMRISTLTVLSGKAHHHVGQWFCFPSTTTRDFWLKLTDQLQQAHRAVAAYKLLGNSQEAEDLAYTDTEEELPF